MTSNPDQNAVVRVACINCRHVQYYNNTRAPSDYECTHPKAVVSFDPVVGYVWARAWVERRGGKCGPDGLLFEPKPTRMTTKEANAALDALAAETVNGWIAKIERWIKELCQ